MTEHLPLMREQLASLERLLATQEQRGKVHLIPAINELISDLEAQIAHKTRLRAVA
jgi:hypothetical protein